MNHLMYSDGLYWF